MELDPEQIAQWKRQYGKIFLVDEYVIRPVTLREKNEVLSGEGKVDQEERLVQLALLYPEDFDVDNCPAGLISSISDEIVKVSGFSDAQYIRTYLENQRERLGGDPVTIMKAMVLAAMPYTEEDLNELTLDQLIDKTVLAEKVLDVWIATHTSSAISLELKDPEEEAELAAQAAARHDATKPPGAAGYDDPIARRLRSAGV